MKKYQRYLLSIFCFLVLFHFPSVNGQYLHGSITDLKKVTIPFATIYIVDLQKGTTSNADGYFELPLDSGQHHILFRCMGFKPITKDVEMKNADQELNIRLEPEVFQIKEVVISNRREDPAYGIMRKVIASAPLHLNQVTHYNSEVYLKGTVVFEKIPRIIAKRMKLEANGKQVIIQDGDVFVEESLNELSFDAPDSYKQVVKSLRNTMPVNESQPVTPIDLIKASFYTPTVFEDIMPCISPLAPNAFAHYKFRYEGFSEEGSSIVDKITVIPRRESQQLFEGTIYVVDNNWSLHSLSLTTNQFWGKIKIEQLYAPVSGDVWLPVSHSIHFDASYLGVKAQFNYTSSVKYSNISLNQNLVSVPAVKNVKKESRLADQFPFEDVKTNRDMKKKSKASSEAVQSRDTVKSLEIIPSIKTVVDPNASKNDSAYWNKIRPVPLTQEENKEIHRYEKEVTPAKKDSSGKVALASGKFYWLMGTRSWYSNDSSVRWRYEGLLKLSQLNFNTVDGFHYTQALSANFRIDSTHSFFMKARLRYNFSRKSLGGMLNGNYTYAPLRRGVLYYNLGRYSMDFNNNSGINQRENSLYSLFYRENLLKIYDKTYVMLQNRIDLANGLESTLTPEWFYAQTLENNTSFSFYPSKKKSYTSNIPPNDFFNSDSSSSWTSFAVDLGISYTPEYYYRISEYRKSMVRSRYPTFSLAYKTAIPGLLGSKSDYGLLRAGIHQKINLPAWKDFEYNLSAGTFLYAHALHFSEFRHFKVQSQPLLFGNFGASYQLIDEYRYSTNKWYLEGNMVFTTPLLLVKRLPFFSERLWDEGLSLYLLMTPELKPYCELGYGVINIFGLVDLSGYLSFNGVHYESVGLKIMFGFMNE